MPEIGMPGLLELLIIFAILGVPVLIAGVVIWLACKHSRPANESVKNGADKPRVDK